MKSMNNENAGAMHGVKGRYFRYASPGADRGERFAHQRFIASRRIEDNGYGEPVDVSVEVRFDDEHRNGHQTFSITGDVRKAGRRSDSAYLAGGCIHEEIAEAFPELAHLVKWHLTSTDGPMHYLANTLYLAGDRDHNGLLKGERRQIRNGRTGQLAWKLAAVPSVGEELSAPREVLKTALEARLPGLLEAFKRDMLAAGLYWSPAEYPES